MLTTLDDFIREYRKIVSMGWIRTHRSGPTGVGKTLEDLLGIKENNLDLRIGQYHGGKKDGQTHDHGTGFRIKEIDQPLLFTHNVQIV